MSVAETTDEILVVPPEHVIAFDAVDLATSAGSVMAVNIVLLGALIQTGILPIPRQDLEAAIRTKTKAAFIINAAFFIFFRQRRQ